MSGSGVGVDATSRPHRSTKPLLRKALLRSLREYWVGTTLATITDDFANGSFEPDTEFEPPLTGARRTLVEQFYHSIDWSDSEAVDRFLSEVVQPVVARTASRHEPWAVQVVEEWSGLLKSDGYVLADGEIFRAPARSRVVGALTGQDIGSLTMMLRRIDRIDEDPELAIGTAKEILEAIALSMIALSGQPPPPAGTDLPRLTKLATKPLGLLDSEVPDSKRGVDSIRSVLQGLAQVVHGTAELRNLYGRGHGRASASSGITPRHARLVVGAAMTWSDFVVETWQAQST